MVPTGVHYLIFTLLNFYRCTRSSPPCCSLKSIEKEFLSSANSTLNTGGRRDGGDHTIGEDQVIAIAQTRGGGYLPVTFKAFCTAVKAGAMPPEFDCLHPFIRAKDFDTTAEFANYQHQYVLDDTGGGVSTGTAHRRVSMALSGRRESNLGRRCHLVLSRNTQINAKINAAARSVVLAVEKSRLCRVLLLGTEFVLDKQDNLWLIRVTSCKVAARPAAALQFTPSLATQSGPHQGAVASRVPDASTPRNATSECEQRWLATEVRSRKREAEEASNVVNDAEFSQLLRTVGYHSPITKRSGVSRRRGRSVLEPSRRDAAPTRGSDGVPEIAPQHAATASPEASNVAHWRQVMSDQGSVDFSAKLLKRVTNDDDDFGEESATNGVCRDAEEDVAGVRQMSPPRPVCTEVYDSSVAKLNQAATNRIYGSSQVL